MKTIIINKLEYNLPEKWDEINLTTFRKIINIATEDKLKYILTLINILTNIDEKILINLNHKYLTTISEIIEFIYISETPTSYCSKFFIGQDKYELKDFDKLTMGEMVSLETYLEKNDNLNNAHYILAILFKKNDEKEFDFDYLEERASEISDGISIIYITKIIGFFLLTVQNYSLILRSYSDRMMVRKGLTKQQIFLLNFLESFSGSQLYHVWRMVILRNMNRFINLILSTVSTSYRYILSRIKLKWKKII